MERVGFSGAPLRISDDCHGKEKPKGGLSLLGRAGMLQGGESDAAITPAAAMSLLIHRVESGDMPPKPRTRLTAEQIRSLREWIDNGAPAAEKIEVDSLLPPRRQRRDADRSACNAGAHC